MHVTHLFLGFQQYPHICLTDVVINTIRVFNFWPKFVFKNIGICRVMTETYAIKPKKSESPEKCPHNQYKYLYTWYIFYR